MLESLKAKRRRQWTGMRSGLDKTFPHLQAVKSMSLCTQRYEDGEPGIHMRLQRVRRKKATEKQQQK